MPVSIVIGGQFGSEGKGKVALELVRRSIGPVTVVRVGGPNSGHTAYDRQGQKYALRQLPAASVDRDVEIAIPAGAYIDVDVLLAEIKQLQYPAERIKISPYARVITAEHKRWESEAGLTATIASTGSGVGGAVMASAARGALNFHLQSPRAEDYDPLQEFIADTSELLRRRHDAGQRIIIEGTQGFGLSLLEGGYWPKATSRSTTASAALAEAGLGPRDVDNVTLVLRAHPIRVAGDSGPLPNETTWEAIAKARGLNRDIREYTTVTQRVRRVGQFDAELVRRAIFVNAPTHIVLNHLDYIGSETDMRIPSSSLARFVAQVENDIDRKIDLFGFSPLSIISAKKILA